MRKHYLLLIILLTAGAANAQQNVISKNPEVIIGRLIRISTPFEKAKIKDVLARNEYGIVKNGEQVENDEYEPKSIYPDRQKGKDEALQGSSVKTVNTSPIASTAGFEGQGYTSVCPADPTIAVGPNHVVQMINFGSGSYFQVWNKTGTVLKATTALDAITGMGGLGDPIAQYDQLDDRFVLTEFMNKPETGSDGLVIAVSVTNDPTGAWKAYRFNTSTFPDYPKYAIWNDAWYAKTNDFSHNRYKGATVYAFDKAAMVRGDLTATVQKFSMGSANKYYSMCPVGLSGSTVAPAGTGGLFAYLNDNTWSGSATDSIGLIECNVNFSNSSLSKVVARASIAVAACSISAPTITQPGGGQSLDALANRVMNQPQYRNFGDHETIVLDYLVNNGGVAAVRWYELRKPSSWTLFQQGTYSPDANHRFMASININGNGAIGLAYNVSSSSVYPSIRATGRLSTDVLGTMNPVEAIIKAGTASSNCSGRYGDYSHVVVDPSTSNFWVSAMYNKASSWSTYVGSFIVGSTIAVARETGSPVISIPVSSNPLDQKSLTIKTTIYPNPVHDILNLINGNGSNSIIQILDGKGHLIQQVRSASINSRLNVSNLASGIYSIKIISGNRVEVQKFVKN